MPNNTPMNPDDEELLNAAGAPPQGAAPAQAPAPPPTAQEAQAMVQDLQASPYQSAGAPMAPAQSVDPTTSFAPPPARAPNPNADLAAFDASKAASDKEAQDIQARANESAAEKAEIERDNARDQSINSASEAVERADFAKKWDDNHAKLEAHANDIQAKYMAALEDSKHPVDMWTGKSTLQKMGAVFGLALGVGGALASGSGPYNGNSALGVLQKQMDAEHQRQQDYVNGLDKAHLMALTHMRDELASRQVAKVDLESQWQAIRQHMIDVGTEKLKARGATDAQIAGDGALNLLKAQQDKGKYDLHQEFSDTMTKHALQKAQEAQAYAGANKENAEAGYYRTVKGQAQLSAADAKKAKADEDNAQKADKLLNADPTYKLLIGTAGRGGGYIPAYQSLQTLEQTLSSARTPQEKRAALNSAEESITKLLSGASPTDPIYQRFAEFAGDPQQLLQKIHKLAGDPTPSTQEVEGVATQLRQGVDKIGKQINDAHTTLVGKYLPKGQHDSAVSHHLGVNIGAAFAPVTRKDEKGNQVPAFENPYDTSAPAAAAPAVLPPGVLPGSTITDRTKGGKPVYKDAQGRLSTPD